VEKPEKRHGSYDQPQKRRKIIECIFGRGKQHGTVRKTKHRGVTRVARGFLLNLIAYNPIRIPKLVAVKTPTKPPAMSR
jgi:hypothetical protein